MIECHLLKKKHRYQQKVLDFMDTLYVNLFSNFILVLMSYIMENMLACICKTLSFLTLNRLLANSW